MKNILFILFLTLVQASCRKDPQINTPSFTNATVIGIGGDCGDAFLIKFDEDVVGLPTSYKTYYAINLPKQLKENGQKIMVQFRKPTNEENFYCTTMHLYYPKIIIIKAE